MIKNTFLFFAIIIIGYLAYNQLSEKNMTVSDMIKASKLIIDREHIKEVEKLSLKEQYLAAEQVANEMMRTGDFSDYEALLNESNFQNLIQNDAP